MSLNLGVIDYGMGNLHSVGKALERLGETAVPVHSPEDLNAIDALILPGVGSFDPAIDNLQATGLVPHLKAWAENNRPLLGICLGLQLLFERSDEGEKLAWDCSKVPLNGSGSIPKSEFLTWVGHLSK